MPLEAVQKELGLRDIPGLDIPPRKLRYRICKVFPGARLFSTTFGRASGRRSISKAGWIGRESLYDKQYFP
jgi:hypothetical protein